MENSIGLQRGTCLNRGSYIRAHVLLNLLNSLQKRDKMLGKHRILYLFYNEFNKLKKNMSTNVRFLLSYELRLL